MDDAIPASWVTRGLAGFTEGTFDNGGDNLYVNAQGVVETIHRTDVNGDGNVDIIFPNAHGYIERGPTRIFSPPKESGEAWAFEELPNDSGWMSLAEDIDGDGFLDLIVVNGENGVTSELDSYIYWGGPGGLTGDRTAFPTAGAYDVATMDLRGNGLRDLIFPSAWVDHHNPGRRRPVQIFEQTSPRTFEDVSERYGLEGMAALSVVCEDLNGNGKPDLVVANYREGFNYDIESFVYWGTDHSFDDTEPLKLPTHFAQQVILGDLNGDGFKEIVFTGGNQIYIYWNRDGAFEPDDVQVLNADGNSTMFCQGAVRAQIVDIDGDGANELIVATRQGVEIRRQDDLLRVDKLLPISFCGWLGVADIDGDGRPEIIASRYQNGKTYEADSVVFWNSDSGFSPDHTTMYPTGGAMGCTAADLNGDGRTKVIFNSTMGGPSQFDPDFPLYIYLGSDDADYSVARRIELPTGGGTNTYILADLDLNGHPDLAIVSPEGLRIFHGGPGGLDPSNYSVLHNKGQTFHYVLVGDFDRNGWLDLIGIAYTYDDKPETLASSSVMYHGGPDGFSDERATIVPTYCSGNAQVADVNNDGWLDLIFYNPNGFLSIYLGGSDGLREDRMQHIPLEAPGVVCAINRADLNGNGWLDLIVVVMGHYTRDGSGFFILEGGPDGYSRDRVTFQPTQASSIMVSVADLDKSGHLDLLVPAYSTQFTRELPAQIYRGNGASFDYDDPMVIPCDSSCAFVANDITGNGYPDLLTICHRNDLGHQVDSLLFWNGPEGISFDRVTRLPGLGPHLASPRDFGNARTREPVEHYTSAHFETMGRKPMQVAWEAIAPRNTKVQVQLRWGKSQESLKEAVWQGPGGSNTYYEHSKSEILGVDDDVEWLQYRIAFVSSNGCASPRLSEVSIAF